MPKAFYTRKEVAKILGISNELLKTWEDIFNIKPHRRGAKVLYSDKILIKLFNIKYLLHVEKFEPQEVMEILRNKDQELKNRLKVYNFLASELSKLLGKLDENLSKIERVLNELK